MKLYDLSLSGNCHKVRLFAALTGAPVEIVPVDFLGGEHKSEPLIGMNPFGEIPVLVDGDVVLRDSQAILVYLARKHGGDAWLPTAAEPLARVMQWLSTAANNVQHGPADARLIDKFGYALDKAHALRVSAQLLAILDAHLATRDWLELGRPTIADIAVFPYVALAPEGGVSLEPWPNVRAWIGRIKALPGFVGMPGIE
ncbi:glutathione S-transferase family protein [Derxia gummosa]|uniref:Glutathione S-transferase family protein n=1 Tax=Derxia gummosa DSM 723 TaxID=1121388 RepID=A0A8B6X5L6_9BURK|nr:glutathione S-transferase [Derxia gummosa]